MSCCATQELPEQPWLLPGAQTWHRPYAVLLALSSCCGPLGSCLTTQAPAWPQKFFYGSSWTLSQTSISTSVGLATSSQLRLKVWKRLGRGEAAHSSGTDLCLAKRLFNSSLIFLHTHFLLFICPFWFLKFLVCFATFFLCLTHFLSSPSPQSGSTCWVQAEWPVCCTHLSKAQHCTWIHGSGWGTAWKQTGQHQTWWPASLWCFHSATLGCMA